MNHRWGIIFNAHAHSKRAHRRWVQMRMYMESKGVNYDFVQSDGKGSVERLSKMLCENGYNTLVLVGADDALNDAVNGILSVDHLADDFALGMIPLGANNDFASFWDITADNWRQAIKNIIARRTRKIDVGVCHYSTDDSAHTRYFLNCVNIGYGARLVELSNQWKSLIGSGRISQLPVYVGQLFERKSFHVAFKVESETIKQEVMSICIGNGPGYGQTPNAVPYNGMIDMSVITHPLWWQMFEGFWLLGRGQFLNYRNVHPYRLRHISFQELGRATISLDGRILPVRKVDKFEVEVQADRLNLIIPAN